MGEAAHGFAGFLGIVAVLVVIGIVWALFAMFGSLVLNVVVAVAGVAIIVKWPGSGVAWFIGLFFLVVGGFNVRNISSNLIKTGDPDGVSMSTVSFTHSCVACGHTVGYSADRCPGCGMRDP